MSLASTIANLGSAIVNLINKKVCTCKAELEEPISSLQTTVSNLETTVNNLGSKELALNSLTDVTTTSVSSGQVLTYNGTSWVNNSLDTTPTSGSSNAITSDAVYTALGDVETLINAL